MAREDIEKMIADALAAAEEPCKRPGRRPLPHAQHILDQYAALCRAEECKEAEATGRVEVPIPASHPSSAPPSTKPPSSATKRARKGTRR